MNKSAILFIALSISTTLALAQDGSSEISHSTSLTNYRIHTGWAPYLSANTGYSGNPSNINDEGIPTSFKAIASYSTENTLAVFDIGYGLQNQQFTQTNDSRSSLSSAGLELAGRYQFANEMQLGLNYNQIFGQGQNFGATQGDAEFGGVQLLKEFHMGRDYLARFGGKILTGINLPSKAVNLYLVEFQIGWGSSRSLLTAAE